MFRKIIAFLKRWLLLSCMVFILAGGSLYYLWIHRYPFTQNAFVVANIRVVSPLVSGYIEKIHVVNNQFVKKGSPLITIYRPPYRLKVEELEHSIEAEKALVKSLGAKTLAQQETVRQLGFELQNARYLADRAMQMYNGAAVSQQYAEEKVRSRQALEAQMLSAMHGLESLRHQITQAEAQTSSLEKQLGIAKIYYEQTIVYALSDGFVANMYISPGAYVSAGTQLFAFIDTDEWFIQANFQETELSEIKPGLSARIWLWQYPGIEFRGVVEAVGWGVDRRQTAGGTALPQVEKENDWFLLPQRYPVQIRIVNPPPGLQLHTGGSAFVQIPVPAKPFRSFLWRLFQI